MLRLKVFVDEARGDYWKASAQDRAAYDFLWDRKNDEPGKTIYERLKPFYVERDLLRLEPDGPTVESFFDFWGTEGRPLSTEEQAQSAHLINEAEKRLSIRITGLVRDLFTYDNGGYTDYVNYPATPWSPLALPPAEFWDNWSNPFAANKLVSVQHWKSANTFFSERAEYLAGKEIETEHAWITSLPGLDRLIVLAASESKSRDTWTLFCLDFRGAGEPGAILLHEKEPFGGPLEVLQSWPSFERMFHRLRRFELREIDGVVRWRERVVEILDKGEWRAPRG